MTHKEIITHSPVKREEDGAIVEGHSCCITDIWDGDDSCENYTEWNIFQNGTWDYLYCDDSISMFKHGTFDTMKYNEIVQEMEFGSRPDWVDELNEEDSWFF